MPRTQEQYQLVSGFRSRSCGGAEGSTGGDRSSGLVPGRTTLVAQLATSGSRSGGAAPGRTTQVAPLAGPAASSGERIPDPVRGKMERSLGADFSGVRIHTGREASSIGAHAFTRGDDIHFAPGQYDPHDRGGQELLGHELAHVVQQREGRVTASFQAHGMEVNADPALEREADELGARAATGEQARSGGTVSGPSSSRVVQGMWIWNNGGFYQDGQQPFDAVFIPPDLYFNDVSEYQQWELYQQQLYQQQLYQQQLLLYQQWELYQQQLYQPLTTNSNTTNSNTTNSNTTNSNTTNSNTTNTTSYSISDSFNFVSSRSGNPTTYVKSRAQVDDPNKYDQKTLSLVNDFVKAGGKNVGTTNDTQVDMCHRWSDLGLRREVDDILTQVHEPQQNKQQLIGHFTKFMNSVWDSSQQTSQQDSKVSSGVQVMTSIINSGQARKPTDLEQKKIDKMVHVISTTSRKNLRPGSHVTNNSLKEKPDFNVDLSSPNKTGNTIEYPMSPISNEQAMVMEEHNKLIGTTFEETDVSGFRKDQSGQWFAPPEYKGSGQYK